MGSARKMRKHWASPRTPFSRERIDEELRIAGEYGLRSKKEIWRTKSELVRYRKRARSLLALATEEKDKEEKSLVTKLWKMGVVSENATISDVLALTSKNFLDRRLQTMVMKRGLAATPSQARQLVVHGHISLKGRRCDVPSYHLLRGEEELIEYSARSPLSQDDHPLRQAMKNLLTPEVKKEEPEGNHA